MNDRIRAKRDVKKKSQTSLRWRHNHKEICNENARRYYKNDSFSNKAKVQRRRTLKLGLLSTFTNYEWSKIILLSDGCCTYCQNFTDKLTMDHIIPISNLNCPGHIASNIVPVCISCNSSKRDKDLSEWAISKSFNLRDILNRIEIYRIIGYGKKSLVFGYIAYIGENMKKIYSIFGIFAILAALIFTPKYAYADTACGGSASHGSTFTHSMAQDANHLDRQTAWWYHYTDYTNNSGHSCTIKLDYTVSTNNGTIFQSLVTSPAGTPRVRFTPAPPAGTNPCSWQDGSTHKSIECVFSVPTGTSLQTDMFWQAPYPGTPNDTSPYTLAELSLEGTSWWLLLSGSVNVH